MKMKTNQDIVAILVILVVIISSQFAAASRSETSHGGASDLVSLIQPSLATVNNWTDLNPASPPSGRTDPAMAYDSKRGHMLLFGGNDLNFLDDTYVFNYTNNTWTYMNPPVKPFVRDRTAMAYDSESDRFVLFGGFNGIELNDTWAYDPKDNTWANMTTSSTPPERCAHRMVYDPKIDRVLLFGGMIGAYYYSDTWSYDYDSNKWTNLYPSSVPPGRYRHGMGYDSQSDRVVIFGGNTGKFENDTWAYDYGKNNWTNMLTMSGPSQRQSVTMAYDVQSDRMLLFGGNTGTFNGETWSYDYDVNQWTYIDPPIRPDARYGHQVTYDEWDDRVILFGGASVFGDMPDTWSFDLANTPRVTGTSPANGTTDVALNESLIIRFSEAMNDTATQSAISASPAIAGQFAWDPAKRNVTWTPSANLTPETKYKVTVNGSATSEYGVGLRPNFTFEFTTINRPVVVSTVPINGEKQIPPNMNIIIEFSEVMDGPVTDSAISASPPITGTFYWDAPSRFVTWDPVVDLKTNTSYNVTVTNAAMSKGGAGMGSDFKFNFTTAANPSIISTMPSNNETNISIQSNITIRFSERMNATTTEAALSSSPAISGTHSWKANDTILTWNPGSNLKDGAKYTVSISTSAKSWLGVPFERPYDFSFTTAKTPPPSVIGTDPANGSVGVPWNAAISVTFDMAMNRSTTDGAIDTTPSIIWGSITWSQDSTKITLTPLLGLQPNTSYTVSISTEATSAAGANLKGPYSFSFKTMDIPDTTPPTIVDTDPGNASIDVNVSRNVFIAFSEPMDRSSTEGAVSMSPGSITSRHWSSGDRVLTLNVTLEKGISYTVTVTADAMDVAGNRMASAYTFRFTTQTLPASQTPSMGNAVIMVAIMIGIAVVLLIILIFLLRKKKRPIKKTEEMEKPKAKGHDELTKNIASGRLPPEE